MAAGPVDIEIDHAWCKSCNICIAVCPAEVFTPSDYVGEKGAAVPLVTNPGGCIRCRLCELMCPDLAVRVVDKKGAGKKATRRQG